MDKCKCGLILYVKIKYKWQQKCCYVAPLVQRPGTIIK